MKGFRYEEVRFIKIIGIFLAFITSTIVNILFDCTEWQYYVIIISITLLIVAVFVYLSYKNAFTKNGTFTTDGVLLYINKAKGKIEIPMDMIDNITVSREGNVVRGYNVKIRVGAMYHSLSSERVMGKSTFWDTSLSHIVREILSNNTQLKNYSSDSNDYGYIWKYIPEEN